MKPKYIVQTWDMEKHTYTPQQGVRKGPYTLWGLKRALRKLQSIGYSCHRLGGYWHESDAAVYVERITPVEAQ